MSNYAKRKQAEALQKKENTKKTIISVAIFVLIVAALVFGFWFGKHLRETKATASGDPNYDVFDYVTLGDYEGLEVYYVTPEVTDEDVQKSIDSILNKSIEYSEVEGRAAQNGDKVTIDFVGKIDGEEFDGGSSEDYAYVLGEGNMIEGFDEGIVGMTTGEEKVLSLTFPEDYRNADVAGKPVEFTINLTKIEEVSYQPEWNDEFVKKYTEDEFSTVAEYEAEIRKNLLESATNTSKSQLSNDIWNAIYENATINGYPEYLYNVMKQNITSNIEATATNYGLSVEQYLSIFAGGASLEEYVLEYVNNQLVKEALIKKMNLTLSDEKYEEMATAELEYYNVDSLADFEEQYGEDTLREYYLNQYLQNKLEEISVVKEVSQEEYDALKKDVSEE